MNDITKKKDISTESNSTQEGEIDFKNLTSFFLRNKNLIIIFSSIGFLVGTIIAFSTPRSWKGQFQIVLNLPQEFSLPGKLNTNDSLLPLLSGGISKQKNIKTEVEILKSPSVMLEVFETVKSLRKKNGVSTSGLLYEDWFDDHLDIRLQENTSIVNVSYLDQNKELIPIVLEKISKSYQDYSTRDNRRGIKNLIEYLEEQIQIYKLKVKESIADVQKFAMTNDIPFLSIRGDFKDSLDITVDKTRIEASGQVRKINNQLKLISNKDSELNEYYYIGILRRLSENNVELPSIVKSISDIDVELAKLRSIFQEGDDSIMKLASQRESLVGTLKNSVIGVLNAEKDSYESYLEATKRPDEFLVKLRTLLYTLAKNEETLNKLEAEFILISLEDSRYKQPWELITNPTLNEKPVKPVKRRVVAIYTLLSLFLGLVASKIKDNFSGLIFSYSQFSNIYGTPPILSLNKDNESNWGEYLWLFIQSELNLKNDSRIAVICLGDLKKERLDLFIDEMKNNLNGNKISIVNDLSEATQFQEQILLASEKRTSIKELTQIKEKLIMQARSKTPLLILD